MNEHYNSDMDQLLDEIIFSRADENYTAELLRESGREDLTDEVIIHRTAACVVQRHEIIRQVSNVHQAFLEKRNGFTKEENAPVHVEPSRYRMMRILRAAAAVLILIPVTLFLYLYITTSPQQLYRSEYQAYRFNVDRSAEQANTAQIIILYQQGKFQAAADAVKELPAPSTDDRMAAGFAFMEMKQYPAAVQLFEAVIAGNQSAANKAYQDEAEYYLALSYLQTGDTGKSLALLTKIFNDKEHTYNSSVDRWLLIRLKWLK